jgi:hypothetical protein
VTPNPRREWPTPPAGRKCPGRTTPPVSAGGGSGRESNPPATRHAAHWIEELSEELARAEEQASRLAIASEEVTRVLEEPTGAEVPAGQDGRPAWEARPGSPIGAVTVLPWQEGAEASVLLRAYQDLLEVAADAGRPLRAGEFAAAAGLSTEKAKVEGLRSKLRLLAARGWLAPADGGLFTLPDHAGKTLKTGQ